MFCKCEHGAMFNNVSDLYEWWVSWSLAETTSLKCMNVNFEMCKVHENETQYGPQMCSNELASCKV